MSLLVPPYLFVGGVAALGEPTYAFANAEAEAVVAAMTTKPNAARKVLIDALVGGLKTDGIWAGLDLLYLTAAHAADAAVINWITPGTYTAIPVNSPTFTADRGYAGNGTSSRLRTQFTPSTQAAKLTQNSASIWVWSRTDVSNGAYYDMGAATSPQLRFKFRQPTDNNLITINDGTTATTGGGLWTSSIGMFGLQRTASNARRTFYNGVQRGADSTTASTGMNAQEQWIGGANNVAFSPREIAMAAWGASLAGLESAFYSRIQTYLAAVGAA